MPVGNWSNASSSSARILAALNFGRARQLLVRKAELYTRFSQLIPYGHGARTLADSLPTSAASSRLAGGSPSDTDGVTSSDSGLISPEFHGLLKIALTLRSTRRTRDRPPSCSIRRADPRNKTH